MPVCPVCSTSKPQECFAGTTCTRCLGLQARHARDRDRGLQHRHRVAEGEQVAYPEQDPGLLVSVPLSYFTKWCRDMKALLPTQYDSL